MLHFCQSAGLEHKSYHFVHEAASIDLEDTSIRILQDVKVIDGLDWVGIWVSLAGKVCEVMLTNKQLSSFPAPELQRIKTKSK